MNQPNPTPRLIDRIVRGTSMDLAGIVPGTLVYIDPQLTPEHGNLVVAHVDGKGDTVKRLRVTRKAGTAGRMWLVPESSNKNWQATPLTDEVTIIGVVVGYLAPGETKVCRDVYGGLKRPAPVISMDDALAGAMLVGQALAQKEHPPLYFYLLTMRHRVWTIRRGLNDWGGAPILDAPLEAYHPEYADMLGFARALGMDEAAWSMVMAGYVPEEAWLIQFAKRLTQLLGEEVPAAELLRFSQGRGRE